MCESQIQLNNSLSVNKNQTSSLPMNSKICFKYLDFGNKQSNNPFLPYNIPPFRGCLKNIYINNQLKLTKHALIANNLEECNLDRICDLSPCLNGECLKNSSKQLNSFTSSNNDWTCRCKPGYQGDFCESASCEKNPCTNQAPCVLISSSQLSCICPASKFGDYCELGKSFLRHYQCFQLLIIF